MTNNPVAASWYKIHLTQDQIMYRAALDIMMQFAVAKSGVAHPKGFALFESANEDGVSSQTPFLPPEASTYSPDLLANYSATPCDEPDADSISHMPIVGDTTDFEFWFG